MDDFIYQTPEQWFDSLEGNEKVDAERMRAMLEQFGAGEPLSWIASEKKEAIAQTARFLFLHEVRKILAQSHLLQIAEESFNQPYHVAKAGEKAAQELLDSGIEPQKLDSIFRAGASSALNNMLNLLDGTYETAAENIAGAPGWSLRETQGAVGQSHLTGRGIDSLHESFDSLYETDV